MDHGDPQKENQNQSHHDDGDDQKNMKSLRTMKRRKVNDPGNTAIEVEALAHNTCHSPALSPSFSLFLMFSTLIISEVLKLPATLLLCLPLSLCFQCLVL